jgi:hypothetical protein
LLTPNEVRTCGGLQNMAGVTLSAHVLRLQALKSFFLSSSPRRSSGDLRCLRLPAKHGGASFALCVGVTNSGSQLVGLLEVAFTWRRRLTATGGSRFTDMCMPSVRNLDNGDFCQA